MTRDIGSVQRVLFVCTGNIFRSLTAEYALRAALRRPALRRAAGDVVVESAGTEDYPHVVNSIVSNYLLTKAIDVSTHKRRTLTPKMLDQAELVVAMSTEHVVALREHFNYPNAPLFTAACGLAPEPLPDVDEAIPDHARNPEAVEAHVRAIIDRIIELTPQLADRLTTPVASRR